MPARPVAPLRRACSFRGRNASGQPGLNVARGWEVMRRSVKALFLRELRTRFGKYRLGYVWAILEPAAQVGILVLILGSFARAALPDISFPVFLINGVVLYSLFSAIASRSLSAVEANAGLFIYRPVRPIDTVLSRGMLEFCVHLGTYVVLMIAVAMLGESVSIDNLPLLLLIFILLSLFSFGIGLIVMVVGSSFAEAEKLVPLLLKPLFFVSGVFFSLQMVPAKYVPYLIWNPIFHAIELARHAVFPAYHIHDMSFIYLSLCALGSLSTGMALYRYRERAMLGA
jgi:capsular polysaccharide transport system permease protein